MKKLLSFLAVAGLACSVLSGCVEDQGYIYINGAIDPLLCDPTSDTVKFTNEMELYTSMVKNYYCFDHITGVKTPMYSVEYEGDRFYPLGVQVRSNIPTELPWKNSGSSGSGATLEITADGNTFLDELVVECYSIDGEKKNCKGIDSIKKKLGAILGGEGAGVCEAINLSANELLGWGAENEIIIKYYVKYHDSSNDKGETNKLYLTFWIINGDEDSELDTNECKSALDSGDKNGGDDGDDDGEKK